MRVIALTSYILEQLVLKGFHVLCVGETGTSKTVVIHDRLKNGMPENFEPILMGFSAQVINASSASQSHCLRQLSIALLL